MILMVGRPPPPPQLIIDEGDDQPRFYPLQMAAPFSLVVVVPQPHCTWRHPPTLTKKRRRRRRNPSWQTWILASYAPCYRKKNSSTRMIPRNCANYSNGGPSRRHQPHRDGTTRTPTTTTTTTKHPSTHHRYSRHWRTPNCGRNYRYRPVIF